ncbi:MAG: ABC transporter permease [Chloroflexi bacterium]|nr:ABC transporter permease [Chloroflexota bacterium]
MATNRNDAAAVLAGLSRAHRGPALFRQVWRFARQKPLGAVAGLIIIAIVFTAVFAEVLAPHDPNLVYGGQRLVAPGGDFPLGTDQVGRDVLSRLIFGARISLWVGLVAVSIGTGMGSLVGITTAYFGGRVDVVVQRFMDMLMAFPALILALTMVAALGSGLTQVMVAIGIVITPGVSRIIRGAALSVKSNQYIEAAQAMGASNGRILLSHILPNVTAPIIVIATVGLGGAIITEASLSFLGLGAPPPTASWGGMVASNRQFMVVAPWVVFFPGIAISLAVMGFNLLGDALRDVWDPRLRGSR